MLGTHWLPKHWSLPAAWQAAGPVAIGRPCSNRSLSGPWPLGRPAPKRMMRWTVSGMYTASLVGDTCDGWWHGFVVIVWNLLEPFFLEFPPANWEHGQIGVVNTIGIHWLCHAIPSRVTAMTHDTTWSCRECPKLLTNFNPRTWVGGHMSQLIQRFRTNHWQIESFPVKYSLHADGLEDILRSWWFRKCQKWLLKPWTPLFSGKSAILWLPPLDQLYVPSSRSC